MNHQHRQLPLLLGERQKTHCEKNAPSNLYKVTKNLLKPTDMHDFNNSDQLNLFQTFTSPS